MKSVGVFGGTFDPVHLGHLVVAQDVARALRLDRVLFVPAGEPPHKEDRVVTDPHLREEMVRGAVEGNPVFEVSEVELRRPGPSYTVDTLRELRAAPPRTELTLIIGADQLADLDTWKGPEELPRLARLAVMTREGEDPGELHPPVDVEFESVPVTRIDLSSTLIRDRVRAGRPIRYLVPEPVRRIIEREGLYR